MLKAGFCPKKSIAGFDNNLDDLEVYYYFQYLPENCFIILR